MKRYIEISIVFFYTYEERDLFDGRAEGVGHIDLGKDDEGAVNRGTQPGDVRMVEERTTLVDYTELVDIRIAVLDGTLRNVCRPVRPC